MDTSSLIDIELLLKPISDDKPVGVNLRQDSSPTSIYYQIKDARNRARTIERQLMQGYSDISASNDWQTVCKLAVQILINHSKDLEVAAWLLEANLRLASFSGLRDSLELIHRLLESYWDTIYPALDDDGYLSRVAIFTGLNGEESEGALIAPISSVKLTANSSVGAFALWEYQQAHEISLISNAEKRDKRFEEGAIKLSTIETAATETPHDFFRHLAKDIQGCLDQLLLIDSFFDEKCKNDSPPLSKIKNTLINCLDAVKLIGAPAFVMKEIHSNDEESIMSTLSDQEKTQSRNLITDRDKALSTILEIANFFQKTEPHSPLSHMLKKVVRWGNTPLPDVLAEVINDESVLGQLYTLMGIEETEHTE